jgi:hypothetical protein
MNPRCRKPSNRAGYALVLFVMIFFGLMGLAALVIDMGFARLAQRQMQTAVDSAALEGLRNDPTTVYGRQQASQIVTQMFADYADSTGATVHYGAGPVVNFSGGIGPPELAASELMQPGIPPGTSPVYQPGGLQFNTGNAQEGDMRAGQYGLNNGSGVDNAYPTQATADEGGNPTDPPNYNPNYNRRDFFQPKSGVASNGFLVRMRRTINTTGNTSNNTSGLDQEAGISSSGVTLPVLFGRGSLMARSGGIGQLSVASGITVRATAIAAAGDNIQFGSTTYSAGRAKAAGPPYQGTDVNNNPVNIPGIAPFALSLDSWASVSGTSWTSTASTTSASCFVAAPQGILQIGQSLPAATPVSVSSSTTNLPSTGYVPIYWPYTGSDGNTYNVIIGFGYIQFDPTTLTVKAESGQVGSGNVSAVLVTSLSIPNDTKGNPVVSASQLFADHVNLLTNPLYAPVLVNHYIGPQQSNP